MKVNSLKIKGLEASYLDWQPTSEQPAEKPKAHFYAANGYPVQVYEPLMNLLAEHLQIDALYNRAQWPNIGLPKNDLRWQTYAADLIDYIDSRHETSIIGIGHSMGATSTIFAAAKRPDLFSQLILIEPAALPKKMDVVLNAIPFNLRRKFLQPGKATLQRRNNWKDKKVLREQVENWKPLTGLDQNSLDSFANHLVIEKDNVVELAFPREWEAHNYFCPPAIWSKLKQVKCPITIIRSESSIFFSDSMWNHWKKIRPQDQVKFIPGYGHLLPLQAPKLCAEAIKAGLKLSDSAT